MRDFGQYLRLFRRQSRDPERGGLLTQERLGELIGLILGDSGYSGAAVSDWERGKSKIHQDDRAVLTAIIQVLHQCGGIQTVEESSNMLRSGNYRALNESEREQIFQGQAENGANNAADEYHQGLTDDEDEVSAVKTKLSSKRRKQRILLEKVSSFWVDGVLNKSVVTGLRFDLEMDNCNELVDHPWKDHFGSYIYENEPLSSEHILKAYLNADRALLILGEPGSGKTMTLLALAEELIDRALHRPEEPIPVILDLSSWAKQRLSTSDWVVEELTSKYQIPRHYGRDWLQEDDLILLLDGYDQLPIECRKPAIRAINNFRETNGLTGIVICSRMEEYRLSGVQLRLSGAVELQPLGNGLIQKYMSSLGSEGEGLRTAVAENPALQNLSQSPLMLGILTAVYNSSVTGDPAAVSGQSLYISEPQKSNLGSDQYDILFTTYVQRLFQQRSFDSSFSQSMTVSQLAWLGQQLKAHSQNVFLIEQLQPSWLPGRKWRWLYMLLSGLLLGIAGGFIIWLLWQLLRLTLPQLPAFTSSRLASFLNIAQNTSEALTILLGNMLLGLVVALLLGMIFEYRLKNHDKLGSRRRQRQWQVLVIGVSTGLLTFLVISWTSGPLLGAAWCVAEAFMYIAAARYIFGWNYQQEVQPVEALGWSWRRAGNGLSIGLVLALLAEVIESLLYGYNGFARTLLTLALAGFMMGGLRGKLIREKSRPNQGVWLSVRNAVLAAVIVSVPLAALTWFIRSPQYALTIGLLSAVIAASIFGASVFIKHFLLRLLLHWTIDLPRGYSRFLDYAARLTFLRKVGGGYIFMHSLLQDYFAGL